MPRSREQIQMGGGGCSKGRIALKWHWLWSVTIASNRRGQRPGPTSDRCSSRTSRRVPEGFSNASSSGWVVTTQLCQASSAPPPTTATLSSQLLPKDPRPTPHIFWRCCPFPSPPSFFSNWVMGKENSHEESLKLLKKLLKKPLSKLSDRYKNFTAFPCRIIQLFQSCTGFPSTS